MKHRVLAAIAVLVPFVPAGSALAQIAPAHAECTADESGYRPGQRPDTAGLAAQPEKKDQEAVNACPGDETRGVGALAAPGGGPGGGTELPQLHETYARQNIREDLSPYGVDLLGEQFDMATGTLSFSQTDVVIPGNNGLEVAIRRSLNTAQHHFRPVNEFGDWELDIPRMEMMVSTEVSGLWQDDRCSSNSDPGDVYYFGNWYLVHEYWNGLKMHIPGQGAQTVLDNPQSPKKHPTNTRKTTNQYWDVACFIVSGASEGFIATAPDGTKYTFGKLRYLAASGILKDFKVMGRNRAQMLVTKVEDRFGNVVNYTYTGSNLTSISSNDGRTISISYGANSKVSSVTANGRTWTYGYTTYTGYNYDFLTSVTWPNGQAWSFDLHELVMAEQSDGLKLICGGPPNSKTGTVTHPYGAKGTYTLTETAHGRTDVPKLVIINLGEGPCSGEGYRAQRSFDVMSLTQKKLEGPGLPPMTWNYVYSQNQGGWLNDGTNPLKTTTVNRPDGNKDVYHFNRSWSFREGSLEKHEVFDSQLNLLQKIEPDYESGPSRGIVGELFYENLATMIYQRNQNETVTTRGTDAYTTAYVFDNNPASSNFSFGRPIGIDQSANLAAGHSRTEAIAYLHDIPNWVLGLETTRTVGTETISEYHYNTNNQVQYVDTYGVQVKEFSYNTDGTVKWQIDGEGHKTTLTSYKRGIPRTITYADNSTHKFVVDNNGWITKSTDGRGYYTNYTYDNVGRMTRVQYPKTDGVTRLDKTIAYATVTSGDLSISGAGLSTGQYKQTKTRGTLKVTSYFDALLRPVLARSQDTSLGSSLDRWTRKTFDSNSNVVFRSFPSGGAAASDGTDSVFDALGRFLEAGENVSPYASTSYAYLSGNRVQVTNPRGNSTTTTYFALGSPDQSLPILIAQPENVTTAIVRNDFGEMTSATQSGGSASATRTYRYDSQHRLCRQVDPETGSTVYAYDGNGQVDWYALAASGGAGACNLASVPAGEKIDLGYNSLNQLISVNYPDSSPDLTYSYDAGGNLETLVSTDASWTYGYDAVNQLTAETLVTGSETFGSSYEFDTQDRLKKITYPSGLVVSVVPNAYGQPESIGSYATAIDYHENGSIASLSYGTQQGSGRVYTTTRNARQLPDNLRVKLGAATIADLTHSYDASANITAITDSVNGTGYNRQMGYDDIDRLETASGFWGSGSYSYDALGNLLTRTEGGQAMSYSYNTSLNRLTGITGANPYSFSYDSYGNVTNNGSQGFTYNRAGNMTSSTGPSITYKYDGHKRRVQKTEGGQTSYTVYGRSGKLLHKKAGGVETDYIYAGSLLIAEKQGSTIHYLHTDLLGSPIAGDNGPAYTEHYRPWGEKKDHPTQLADDVGYTGHQDDVATGLTYMQARYYDPVVGRFYAVDPVGFDGSNLEHYGRFAYAYNNPFAYVDLDGREGKGFFEAIADNTRVKFGLSVGLNLKVSTPGLGFEAGIGEFASIAGSTSLSGQDQMEVSSSGPHLGGHIAGHPIGYQERVTTAISDTDDVTGVEKFREESSDGMFTETKTGDEQTRFEATSKTLLFEWKGAVKFSVEFDYFGYKDDRIEEQE